MTSSSDDPKSFQPHRTTKQQRKELAIRMKDPLDELKLVIVRDMWLTGFDAPSMHTMYVDKKMQGANLMQAIARVNRVYKDKPRRSYSRLHWYWTGAKKCNGNLSSEWRWWKSIRRY